MGYDDDLSDLNCSDARISGAETMTQFKHDKSCPVYGDLPADDVPCQCKGEQDSLTVGQIRVLKFWLAEYAYIGKDETEFTDKTEFYTPEEVKDCLLSHIDTLTKQVESQDEITDALHIVNAELGRRVESQKEVATKYHELLYQVAEKYPNETRHETALRYIKRAEEPSNCCAGEDQLPKEE